MPLSTTIPALSITPGYYTHLRAHVTSSRMVCRLQIDKKIGEDGESTLEDFVASSEKDIEIMYEHALQAIKNIKNAHLRELLERIFKDPTMLETLKYHPGAISIHHNWLGGLLEHSLEILEYCELASRQFPSLDYDLLVAGSLLHDIGKVKELAITARIKGTTEGQFIGHLVLGTLYVSEKISETKGFPEAFNKY